MISAIELFALHKQNCAKTPCGAKNWQIVPSKLRKTLLLPKNPTAYRAIFLLHAYIAKQTNDTKKTLTKTQENMCIVCSCLCKEIEGNSWVEISEIRRTRRI